MSTIQMLLESDQELQQAYRLLRERLAAVYAAKPSIHGPEDVAELLAVEMAALEQEHLRVILLNTRNQVLRVVEVVRGSVNSAQVRIAEIFREAVRENAVGLILVHNHPSGDPSPSPDDIALTRQVVQAGELLDIRVLDHIIVGAGAYVSLREMGVVVFSD